VGTGPDQGLGRDGAPVQIDLGPCQPRKRPAKRVLQLRERRPRFGELIQIDASPHAWLENRSPK